MISLKKLITANSGESSKRFISLVCLFLLITCVVAALFGKILPEYYIITIASLVGANQALTLFQRPTYYQPPTYYQEPEERLGRADNP